MLFWHEAQFKSQVFVEYGPWQERSECIFTSFKFWHEGIAFLDKHLIRLKDGCFFYWPECADESWKNIESELAAFLMALRELKMEGRARINIYHDGRALKLLAKVEIGPFESHAMNLMLVKNCFKTEYPSFIKHPEYAAVKFWKTKAQASGYNDVLYHDMDKNLYECSTSNFFVMKEKKLITPKDGGGIFAGIIRQKIIEMAKANNIEVLEEVINLVDLKAVSAAFTTNCVYGIRVVKKIEQYEFDSEQGLVYIQKIFNDLIASSRSWTCLKK